MSIEGAREAARTFMDAIHYAPRVLTEQELRAEYVGPHETVLGPEWDASLAQIKSDAVASHNARLGFWTYPEDPRFLVKPMTTSTEPTVAVWMEGDVMFRFWTASSLDIFTGEWNEHRDAARAYFKEHP